MDISISPPAPEMTTTTSSICRTCGTIKKFGKSSCCGRGGSWFRNCGSGGDTKRRHTWYEGIQACEARAQLETVSGQESNAAQQPSSAHGVGTVKSKSAINVIKPYAFSPANTLTTMPGSNPVIIAPANVLVKASNATSDSTSTGSGSDTLTTTTISAITSPIKTTTMITQTAKEETTTTDWISQGMYYARSVFQFNMICTSHAHTHVSHLSNVSPTSHRHLHRRSVCRFSRGGNNFSLHSRVISRHWNSGGRLYHTQKLEV